MVDYIRNNPGVLKKDQKNVHLLWSLIKCKAPNDIIDIALRFDNLGFCWTHKLVKRLGCYYYFSNTNQKFGTEQNFEFLKSKLSSDITWGSPVKFLQPISNLLTRSGISNTIYGNLDGLIAPLVLPGLNYSIIPLNNYILGYYKNVLRGEFELIKNLQQQRGIKVITIDAE